MAPAKCWREVDRLCRIREADAVIRGTEPLSPEESVAVLREMGISAAQKSFWQKMFAF